MSQGKKGIHRRMFNRWLFFATALSGVANARNLTSEPPHIAVIGAGIVGSSIAYNLVKRGARVTLIDRSTVGGATSRGTFAWINATWAKQPRHYHAFNQSGIAAWQRLQAELNLEVKWGGSLEWFESEARQGRLASDILEQQLWGEPAKMVDLSEAQMLEPLANFRGATEVAYSPRDGAVDATRASQRLVSAAERLGLRLRDNCSVNRVREGVGGLAVLETDCGEIVVDKYVLATGANQQATLNLAGIDIPQRTTPGVVVITKPVPKLLNTIFVAPGVHIHQRGDGRLVLGEQEGPPETEAHAKRLSAHPTRFPSTALAQQHASRLLETARHFLPSLPTDIALEEVLIGWRPLPLDGHPVLGVSPTQPKSYIAIMHSGVSLAPIVGELVSQELITGVPSSVLEPYRPNRNFQRIQRY